MLKLFLLTILSVSLQSIGEVIIRTELVSPRIFVSAFSFVFICIGVLVGRKL